MILRQEGWGRTSSFAGWGIADNVNLKRTVERKLQRTFDGGTIVGAAWIGSDRYCTGTEKCAPMVDVR